MTAKTPEPDAKAEMVRRMNKRREVPDRLDRRRERSAEAAEEDERVYQAVLRGACHHCLGERKLDVGDMTTIMRDCEVCGGTGRWP